MTERVQLLVTTLRRLEARARVSPFWGLIVNDSDFKATIAALAAVEVELSRVPTPLATVPVVPAAAAITTAAMVQCLWCGAHGRCIKPHGHHGPHEELNYGSE
jgi:hypothetical protein